jgi:hypothetical protein
MKACGAIKVRPRSRDFENLRTTVRVMHQTFSVFRKATLAFVNSMFCSTK